MTLSGFVGFTAMESSLACRSLGATVDAPSTMAHAAEPATQAAEPDAGVAEGWAPRHPARAGRRSSAARSRARGIADRPARPEPGQVLSCRGLARPPDDAAATTVKLPPPLGRAMRRLGLGLLAAFALGSLLAFAAIALFADAPQPAALASTGAPFPPANATLPDVGPVNDSVSVPVDVPANLSGVRVSVTLLQGATVGLRADGLGCGHSFGDLTAQGQTLSFECSPAAAGHQALLVSQRSGSV